MRRRGDDRQQGGHSVVEAIISVDEAQHIVLFNKSAEEIFGYRADEVMGRPLDLLLPARVSEAHRQHIRGFAAEPETARRMAERRELSGRRKDGTEFRPRPPSPN